MDTDIVFDLISRLDEGGFSGNCVSWDSADSAIVSVDQICPNENKGDRFCIGKMPQNHEETTQTGQYASSCVGVGQYARLDITDPKS